MKPRRRIPSTRAIFEDHVVVVQKETANGVWAECSLSLKFDQHRNQAMISLYLEAEFSEVDARRVTLQLSPENLQQLDAAYNPRNIPTVIRQHFSRDTVPQSHSDLLLLSLSLKTPGRLITPKRAEILTPTSESLARVQNYRDLCQAMQLLLYIPTRDFPPARQSALRKFISLSLAGRLTSIPSRLGDLYAGRGGRQSTWEIFHIPEPPPSYESQIDRSTVKRIREESPASQAGAASKRLAGESTVHSRSSDFEIDSLNVLSPVHAAISPHSSSALPAVHSAPQTKLLQEAFRAELNATLPCLLREMLPDLIHAELRSLFFPERSSSSSQDSDKSCSSSSTPDLSGLFADRVVEPLVLKHLKQAVRDYIDMEDPVEEYLGAADVAIEEAAHTARLEVLEVKEESIKEIKQAEIDVVERLTGVDWNLIGKEIMGLTPSQDSCSDQPDSRVGTTTARREEPLGQEGCGQTEIMGDRRPRNRADIRDGTSTSEARRGKNSAFQTGGFRYVSDATTENVTEDIPSQPQSSDAHRPVRSGSSRSGWSNATRENSRTSSSSGIRQPSPSRDHEARPLGSDNRAELGTEVGNAHSGHDCDDGDDEREEDSRGEHVEQQGELFGLAGRECFWSTTEPDTESDVPG